MLTKLTLESAAVLAEELEKRKVGIVPDSDTPVEELFEASSPITDKVPETKEAIVKSLEMLSMSPIEVTPETHDNILDNITSQVVGVMNRRLQLAKNTINPLIARYTDMISKHVEGYVPETAEIKEVDFGDFYRHPLVREIFKGYVIKGVDPVAGFRGIQFTEENNYNLDALNTGSEFIDNKLKAILEERGQEWYQDLANRYFTTGEDITVSRPEVTEEYREVADRNLVAHMLARHFYNRNEPLTDIDKAAQDSALLDILARTSQNINALCDLNDRCIDNGIVVEKRIATESITVFGPTYRKYLEQGGTDMALSGYVKSKGPAMNMDAIIQAKTSLENIHDKEMSEKVRRVRVDMVRLIHIGAAKTLPDIIKEIPTELTDTITEFEGKGIDVQTELYRRGIEYINSANPVAIEDIYSYASNIITLGLLPELELHMFYNTMDKYLRPTAGAARLTPKQAAYYACLEEITKYFLSQVSLSSVK